MQSYCATKLKTLSGLERSSLRASHALQHKRTLGIPNFHSSLCFLARRIFFEHKLLKTKCLRLGHLSSEHCWMCHSALKQPQHSSAFNNNVMSATANDNADSNRSYAYPMESHLFWEGNCTASHKTVRTCSCKKLAASTIPNLKNSLIFVCSIPLLLCLNLFQPKEFLTLQLIQLTLQAHHDIAKLDRSRL